MGKRKCPENILKEYQDRKHEIDDLYSKMNNIYGTVESIRAYQKLYEDKVESLDRDLYGEYLEYIFIDKDGDHFFQKRKVADGKFEAYRDLLVNSADKN